MSVPLQRSCCSLSTSGGVSHRDALGAVVQEGFSVGSDRRQGSLKRRWERTQRENNGLFCRGFKSGRAQREGLNVRRLKGLFQFNYESLRCYSVL